jgi:hypothetical protein
MTGYISYQVSAGHARATPGIVAPNAMLRPVDPHARKGNAPMAASSNRASFHVISGMMCIIGTHPALPM